MNKLIISLILMPCFLLAQSHQIYFQSGTEYYPESQIQSRGIIPHSNAEIVNNTIYRYIQFKDIPTASERHELKSIGVELFTYIPNYTYLCKIQIRALKHLANIEAIRYILESAPKRKISPDIYNGDIGDWALSGHTVQLMLNYFPGIDLPSVIQDLNGRGAQIVSVYDEYELMYISYPLDNIYELANSPVIAYYDVIPEEGLPEDTEGRALHRSNMINNLNPLGLKFDGTGISVLTRDDGLVGPHIDFQGRLDPTDSYGYLGIQHGDMVSGIFAGAGNRDPQKKGMASGANLLIQNYADHFLNGVIDLHKQKNMVITNSSYSNGCNAGYTIITRTVDQQLNDNPTLLHVFSAGNSNNRDCGYGAGTQWGNITGGHKIAKNCIATANLDIDIKIAPSSSRGPAIDGRLKPDISARGVAQLSTAPNSTYQTGGGTSAASPGIAGISAQLYQVYRSFNNDDYPEAALIKSCMLNTADDLGNAGPDFTFGFGHVNALKAYNLLKDRRYIYDTVGHQEERIINYNLDQPAKQLKIMLYWREKPGAINASKALVNDLDMTISSPDGRSFQPLILDHRPDSATLKLPATQGRDSINNVEQIVIDDASAGQYVIRVNGRVVPDINQKFILLYEPIFDEIIVTYPMGEEHLEPGSTAQIHWDAFGDQGDFVVEYSSDNGGAWELIANVPGNRRALYWKAPDVFSGQYLVRVTREAVSGQSPFNFSVMPTVRNMRITQICPNYVKLTWDSMAFATQYYIYALGERYMEIVDSTDVFETEVYIDNPLNPHWFALQALGPNNALSERNIAMNHPQELLACPQEVDLAVKSVVSPGPLVFDCGNTFNDAINVILSNTGMSDVQDITMGYQFDGRTKVEEVFNQTLSPNETTDFAFGTLPDLASGMHEIKIWCSVENDLFKGNDTLSYSFEFIPQNNKARPLKYLEEFKEERLPDGWTVGNDLMPSVSQWQFVNGVKSKTGRRTISAKMYNYNNQEVYYSDRLRTTSIDLTTAVNPVLKFDWVGASADSLRLLRYFDTLKINIYSLCNRSLKTAILELTKEDIITAQRKGAFNRDWLPNSKDQWKTIGVTLDDFVGDEIVIEFELVNGDRAQFFIDNVTVEESAIVFEKPDVEIADSLCIRQKGTVQINNPDPDAEYKWFFKKAFLRTSAEGPGPHTIRYSKDGHYEIILSIIKEDIRKSQTFSIQIFKKPAIKFDYKEVNPLTISFSNGSVNFLSFSWDFGDGTTSDEIEPVHVFPAVGAYNIILYATNQCTTRVKKSKILVGNVSVKDYEEKGTKVSIYPNPASDVLYVELDNAQSELYDVNIYNISGAPMGEIVHLNANTQWSIPTSHLPPGIYLLRIKSNKGYLLKRFIVQQ